MRSFTQDDAHIFCTPDQLTEECLKVNDLVQSIYRDFGFENVRIKLSTRPENRIGSEESWDRAEGALILALDTAGHDYTIFEGEGRFMGQSLNTSFGMPLVVIGSVALYKLILTCPNDLEQPMWRHLVIGYRPVMLHRALFGSLERFTGILIEHYSGRMPAWLSPVQIVVASITDQSNGYACEVAGIASSLGLRVEKDLRNEKISYKVREHSVMKVPFILAVGGREAEAGTVALRRLGSNEQRVIDTNEALAMLRAESLAPDMADERQAEFKNTQCDD